VITFEGWLVTGRELKVGSWGAGNVLLLDVGAGNRGMFTLGKPELYINYLYILIHTAIVCM
jgi:hypothetical protein